MTLVLSVLIFVALPAILFLWLRSGQLSAREKLKRIRTANEAVYAAEVEARKLCRPANLCHVTPDIFAKSACESRLGGWPAWPKDKPLPRDSKGAPYLHLAQINLEDMPAIEDFPATGILQFFISSDEDWGYGTDPPEDGSLVIYHPVTDELILQNPYPDGWTCDCVPFDFDTWQTKGLALRFEAETLPPSIEDYRIDALLEPHRRYATDHVWESLHDHLIERHEKVLFNIGGHPRFIQQDIRRPDVNTDKDVCLLSVGSGVTQMMWGDAGEACFLIARKDLLSLNFKNVLYSGDCG